MSGFGRFYVAICRPRRSSVTRRNGFVIGWRRKRMCWLVSRRVGRLWPSFGRDSGEQHYHARIVLFLSPGYPARSRSRSGKIQRRDWRGDGHVVVVFDVARVFESSVSSCVCQRGPRIIHRRTCPRVRETFRWLLRMVRYDNLKTEGVSDRKLFPVRQAREIAAPGFVANNSGGVVTRACVS